MFGNLSEVWGGTLTSIDTVTDVKRFAFTSMFDMYISCAPRWRGEALQSKHLVIGGWSLGATCAYEAAVSHEVSYYSVRALLQIDPRRLPPDMMIEP